jgi:hypothetical protein
MQTKSSYICDSCGEAIIIPLDLSAGENQVYVEVCPVCCRPNVIYIEIEKNGWAPVSAERSDGHFSNPGHAMTYAPSDSGTQKSMV